MSNPLSRIFGFHRVRKGRVEDETMSTSSISRPSKACPLNKAAENVFEIPELLGNILSFVPTQDLLTKKQLVSKAWKATIETTPAIQQKLWQKVKNPEVAWPVTTTHWPSSQPWPGSSHIEVATIQTGVPVYTNRRIEINRLALPLRAMEKGVARMLERIAEADPSSPLFRVTRPTVQVNSRGQKLVKPHRHLTTIETTPVGELVTVGLQVLRSLCRASAAKSNNNATLSSPSDMPAWTRQFITDPPVSVIWLSFMIWVTKLNGKKDFVEVPCSLRVPSGVTFADVCEVVGKVAASDAIPQIEISTHIYDVRVCFLADGIAVDGVKVFPQTKWV